MKAVIVAKTRRGKGACIGALTFEGRSLRLVEAGLDAVDGAGLEYALGEVWEIRCRRPKSMTPPHVENVTVSAKQRLAPLQDLPGFIQHHMPPVQGGVDQLFEGRLGHTSLGALYVTERLGLPTYSTLFWRPDRALERVEDAKRIRYRYPTAEGGRTLTYVGFQEALPEIPPGALLRVSLSQHWRPPDQPEAELRCYVQLSGWFLPGLDEREPPPPEPWEAEPSPQPDPEPEAGSDLPIWPASTQPATLVAARKLLNRIFGYDDFRSLQAQVLENVLARRDTLAIMPTGSGKSLCYQLPALLFPGLTVVVSPLISLMQDQVTQLRELGIPAVYLNSSLTYAAYLARTEQIRQGQVKLLYVAPETLLRPETLLLLEQCPVVCLTIDEAHCIAQWGHDFRPEYQQLAAVRRRMPQAVCIALTATATPRVQVEIKESLGFQESDTFVAGFDRPNLLLSVQQRVDGVGQVDAFLQSHRDQSGIIYCATRRQVEMLATRLTDLGWSVLPYHAGLDGTTRHTHHRRFLGDQVPIMIATVAFGMGINKPDVRFVVHYNLPKDLESYYQQVGRAGRDGLQADCLMLFAYDDLRTIHFFIEQQSGTEQQGATLRLQAMRGYAETDICRRRPLLSYFGESAPDQDCQQCDNCLAPKTEQGDLTLPAQKFLSCVIRTGQRFGITYVVDVLRGSKARRILDQGHDQLSTYGIGLEFTKKEWTFLGRQFIQKGLLAQDLTHGGLSLTVKGREVLQGEKVWGAQQPMAAPGAAAPSMPDADPRLFQQLRSLRMELAATANLPAYAIFPDRTLLEMAVYFPQSEGALAQIHGVGEAKLQRYGEPFLTLLRHYCQEHEIPEKRRPARSPGVAPSLPEAAQKVGFRTWEVASAYNNGQSIQAVAESLHIQTRTVINHLWRFHQAGHALRPEGFAEASGLEQADRQRVIELFEEHGSTLLHPLFQALEGKVAYDELQLLRLWFVSQKQNA